MIEAPAIECKNISQYPAIPVAAMGFDQDFLTEHHLRGELFGPVAKRLAFFKAINTIQSDFFTPSGAHDGYGVAIGYPHDFTRKFFGPDGRYQQQQ